MTSRYNPHSIEKQVKNWPVLFSEKDLHKDIVLRLQQLTENSPIKGWISPFSVSLPFDKDFIYEYGIDACRIATINSSINQSSENLLESAYKWVAKIHDSFTKKAEKEFNPLPWLEAITQGQDHILARNADRLALALIMKAVKESAPHKEMDERAKKLVYSALSIFVPIFTASAGADFCNSLSIKEAIQNYEEYYCVKIALEKGGWHKQVFLRKSFEENPKTELLKIKWIKKAISDKDISIKEDDGGIRVCFS